MTRFDRVTVIAVTALAALLRLPGIDARGRFDADQGHDMLTLVAFTRDGIVPLLGPKTSVGEFHHGAFYYFLLAPAAAISNGDPVAVTTFLALLGIGAVALTWWLARSIGGPLAGMIAGILLASSPAAIDESTFIWNPNPIAFFAVLALIGAWQGRATAGGADGSGGADGGRGADGRGGPDGGRGAASGRRQALWWTLSIGSAGAVTQLHVLGVVFLIAILVLCLLTLRRDRRVVPGLAGGLVAVAVLFLPLLAHELQTGFQETRLVLDYLRTGGGESIGGGPVSAVAFTLLRVTGWPLMGLVTDVPALAAILLAVVVALAAVGLLRARGDTAVGLRWLVGILAWSTLALAFAAPSLQRVVAGLPNDHYHAFIDPIVVILIAVPAAGLLSQALAAWRSTRRPGAAVASLAIAGGLMALVAVTVIRKPPLVDPDGGWPAMRAAGARIVAEAGGAPVALVGVPDFKLPDAVGFPIEYAGGSIGAVAGAARIVVACDRLFEAAIGLACGGPAEDAQVAASRYRIIDRFDASPRTVITVYGP